MFPARDAEALAIARAIYRRVGLTIEPPPIRVSDVKTGRYYWKPRARITLPVWLWDGREADRPGYTEWYIAHELAHGLSGMHGHGTWFQLVLWWLAPDVWHWEATYDPPRARCPYAATLKLLGEM